MEDNRFIYNEDTAPKVISNDSIQCADCVYRTDPMVIECVKYLTKPDPVLEGTGPCKYYEEK